MGENKSDIVINHQVVTTSDIDRINGQGNIEIIDFNFCTISGDDIKFAPPLRQLIFAYTLVDFNSINGLDGLKELEIVNDEEDEIKVDIKDLLKFPNIETLRIYNSIVVSSAEISKFAHLKELYLDGSTVDAEDFLEMLSKDIKVSHNDVYLFD